MTEHTATSYLIERKVGKEWRHYTLGDTTQYRLVDGALKELNSLRTRFPDEEFRLTTRVVKYHISESVYQEAV